MQLFAKNYNFVCKKYVKSTSLLPVLFLTIQPHLCYSLIEIKLDNAKWQAEKLVLLVCSEPKFESQWLHFMGVEKKFFYVFFNSKFYKKELKKMQKLKVENVIDLSLLKEDFFLEILNLITKAKEKENVLSKKQGIF